MDDLTGRQFGPYQIVGPVGEGGMAAVYKAYQPSMERYVALKVLPRTYAEDPQFVSRFKREATLLAQLQHPHILPVFDSGIAEGYTYIVMPFIQGGKLTDLMKGEPLPLARIRQVIAQVGDALDYAHERGMIHRDVKPSNVLIDERGNCLLTDFGLARMVEDSVNLTSTGTIMGTPAYMSPEQGSGQKIDARSDIYSLGIVLFEMATGRAPYQAETPVAIVFKHIRDPLPLPRKVNPQLTEAVERVTLKALSKRPEDRYQAAGDMVRAIQLAIPDSPIHQEPTLLKKKPTKAEAPALPVPEGGLSPTLVPKKRSGAPIWIWGSIGVVILALMIGGGYWAYRADLMPFRFPELARIDVGPSSTPPPKATALPPSETPLPPELLQSTGVLQIGHELLSTSERFSFEFRSDGDLVVWDNIFRKSIWSSNTRGTQADHLVMQDDGNLNLFAKAELPVWSSKTNSTQGDYFLAMQDDGNLVIYRGKSGSGSAVPIWATNSVQIKEVPESGPGPIPVDPAAVLFQQNFEKGSPNNRYDENGSWRMSSDESGNHYLCNNVSVDWQSLMFGSDYLGNYAVEARVEFLEQKSRDEVELYARLTSDGAGYRGTLTHVNAFMNFWQPYKALADAPITAKPDTWHTLRLEAYENWIKLFIDNQPVGIAEDDLGLLGKSGVGVGPNTKACVDDIRVWELTETAR